MEENHLCSLCPVTDAARARLPEPPELEGAPMSTLSCGHEVHTHCLINEIYTRRQEANCAECQLQIMRETAAAFFRERDDYDGDITIRQPVTILWNNNEEFRNDVKEYKKLNSKVLSTYRDYSKELGQIKQRFKQNVLTSIELIKDQKRQAIHDLNTLASRKTYKRASGTVMRKLDYIRRKWDISIWNLKELNDIEGAPKIPRRVVYSRWRSSPKYIFSLKL